ncbi:hypothetical protein COU62_01565 [Candidatus Pacearchaeota archaeon CG10_big_fil_rev_8_21_14_0_10_35_219]|nr:glycosyltransferase [Candidatus Pacearchaeota archaeon]OIO43411.1 MAG: hypothetical protein AUJ63_00790 [Candidatus Pacearchaeota archaeon CG1_02_35_32]PIO08056.1 MAG: hypothetical protein COU62_01565 [Candidatus Pacearchaeota archaeon CG10_big_fil_rev_8_21_14_0_10_35_219]PIY81568.1 MAG: hypothetical protein COY79_02405 [Candidatus Pacearchaeota archaeon CG_4_10_14_0_8_um_filter_35_169]PIZ78943.1 MAG: hypothetical protein COY00_04790 [Candidatus Pacearchaeota archaeon CG_4_10_14_0_2_um_filte
MISIIISAHNEEKNIKNILEDVIKEMSLLREDSKLFIGLSGCTDKTEKIARDTIKNHDQKILIVKTPLGKISSQKKIIKLVNEKSWGILFLDCDVRLKKYAIRNIVADARRYQKVKMFYAKEIPLPRKSIFYNIINVRTLNPNYVIAKENVSDFHPYIKNKNKKVFATGGMYLIRRGIYDVDGKTIGDDSYLTHSIYHRFGFGTIKQTENAIVYYQPVYTFRSWIKKWERIWSDINNLYSYHPEFKYQEKYMKLKIGFRKLIKERKIKLIIFFSFERTWNNIGGFVFRKFLLNKESKWDQLKDTKEVIFK